MFCAALTATSVAPAQADPSEENIVPASVVVSPSVDIPELLGRDAEPRLTGDPVEADAVVEEPLETGLPVAEPVLPKPSESLADMVAQLRSSEPGSRELECLAVGIYFEAKSEPLIGQLAVGEVIANRADSGGRFPSTYCGVLLQRGQFSFIRGRSWPAVKRNSRQWQNAVAIAKIVDQDLKDSAADKALFFHARYVSPRWRLKRVASIGNHVFYR
jgi:N-acetylmuramoyl-L-alanine amidase